MSSMSKKIKIVFTFSVLLNVLLLGVSAGYALKRYTYEPWSEMKETLAPETRELLRTTLKERLQEARPRIQAYREARSELEAVLTAKIFDEKAYALAAKRMIDLGGDISAHKMETIRTLASALPVEERRKMAQKFVRVLSGKGPREHREHGDKFGAGLKSSGDHVLDTERFNDEGPVFPRDILKDNVSQHPDEK